MIINTTMNSAIELLTNRGSVWKFEDPALESNEFVSGFLYGGMFLLKQLPKDSNPYFIVHDTAVKEEGLRALRIDSVSQLRNFGDISSVELDKVQANMTRYMDVPRKYIFMLYDPKYTGEFNMFYIKFAGILSRSIYSVEQWQYSS